MSQSWVERTPSYKRPSKGNLQKMKPFTSRQCVEGLKDPKTARKILWEVVRCSEFPVYQRSPVYMHFSRGRLVRKYHLWKCVDVPHLKKIWVWTLSEHRRPSKGHLHSEGLLGNNCENQTLEKSNVYFSLAEFQSNEIPFNMPNCTHFCADLQP